MGWRNWSSRLLDGVQWEEFYNTGRELLFTVCEHPQSRNTSPSLLVSLLETSVEGYKRVSFLIILARANSGIQKLVRARRDKEGEGGLRVGSTGRQGVTCLPQRIPKSPHTKASFRIEAHQARAISIRSRTPRDLCSHWKPCTVFLSQKGQRWCSNNKEIWAAVQVSSCLCHFLVLEAACSTLPVYSGNVYPSHVWWGWRLDGHSLTVSLNCLGFKKML